MKSSLDILMQKAAKSSVSRKLLEEGIELISDELALELRGGDKDYSPTYAHETKRANKFTDPSILLKLP